MAAVRHIINKQPSTADLEEGSSQGTNATSNEPKLVSDQEQEPSPSFKVVEIMTLDKAGSYSKTPIMWSSSAYRKYCCIYRVPNPLRRVKPDAYDPQMLLIGPLDHSKKADSRYMKMEQHKKTYLGNFFQWFKKESVDEFRRIIKKDEEIIRACYAESTESIKSDDFVKMMLLDSVFILVFFMHAGPRYMEKTGNFILDEPSHQQIILEDLVLLENQLPYFLLENLIDPLLFRHVGENQTCRDLILEGFGLKEEIKAEVEFLHFTDLIRRVHVQTLGITEEQENIEKLQERKSIMNLHNADMLHNAGVKFIPESKNERNMSLMIKFKRGILTMPCFNVLTESNLRNIMALEQCHYIYTTYVCDYIAFLNFLIDTEQDVELLIRKGVVVTKGHSAEYVADMVNKLSSGVVVTFGFGSHYYEIAQRLNKHYDSLLNRTLSALQRVYFKDLWTGTATVTAVIIVVLTLIGTVASVFEVMNKDD